MKLITTEEFDRQVCVEASEHLLKKTIQFFRVNSEEGMVAHGSGILFCFQDEHFIITAAHNFKNEVLNELRVRVGNNLLEIHSEEITHSKMADSLTNDTIDIAIIRLINKELIIKLREENIFIGIDDLLITPIQKEFGVQNPFKSDYYILFGYPGSQTKLHYGSTRSWKVKVLFLNGYLYKYNTSFIVKKGYANHIFLNKMQKGKRNFSTQKTHLPKLKGMSGCGLWDIDGYDLVTQKLKYKLAGIFIEVGYDLIISTKIDFAIEMIRHKYNLTDLPKSRLPFQWKSMEKVRLLEQ